MDDTTARTGTDTNTELHDKYVSQINHLVSQDREALIADLSAEYERVLQSAPGRRAA